MAQSIITIKKRATFLSIRNKGKFIKGESLNVQTLQDTKLNELIAIGFTSTKKIGNAVKRNRSKRIMRELARKVIIKYGKKNAYYVLIAKSSIFDKTFNELENELKKLIS